MNDDPVVRLYEQAERAVYVELLWEDGMQVSDFDRLLAAWEEGYATQRVEMKGPRFYWGGHPVGTTALRAVVDREGWGGPEFMIRAQRGHIPAEIRWEPVDEREAIGVLREWA